MLNILYSKTELSLVSNDSINFQKTYMFIGLSKINFIIYFFFDILHFKEICNLIGQQNLAHNSRNRI